MAPIPVLHRQPLAGRAVELRDAAERDIPEVLIAYQDDPELHLRLGEPRPPSGAELGRRADTEAEDRAAGRRAALTVVEPGDDFCQGQVHLHDVDWDHRRASLSLWIAPGARGRGLATGALALVAGWLLSTTELLRVQVLVDPANEPMLRAARGAGFVEEGVLRGYWRARGGGRTDTAVLSLLPGDLEAS